MKDFEIGYKVMVLPEDSVEDMARDAEEWGIWETPEEVKRDYGQFRRFELESYTDLDLDFAMDFVDHLEISIIPMPEDVEEERLVTILLPVVRDQDTKVIFKTGWDFVYRHKAFNF